MDNNLIDELEHIIVQCDECESPSKFELAVNAKIDEIANTQNTDLLAQAMLLILSVCYGEDDD